MPCHKSYKISVPNFGFSLLVETQRDGVVSTLTGLKYGIDNCSKSFPVTLLAVGIYENNDNIFDGNFTSFGLAFTITDPTGIITNYRLYSDSTECYMATTTGEAEPTIFRIAIFSKEIGDEDDQECDKQLKIFGNNCHRGNWHDVFEIKSEQLLLFGYLFVTKNREIISINLNVGSNQATLLDAEVFYGNNNYLTKCKELTYEGVAFSTTSETGVIFFFNMFREDKTNKVGLSFVNNNDEEIVDVVVCDLKLKKLKCCH
jgi:hypothetical protein